MKKKEERQSKTESIKAKLSIDDTIYRICIIRKISVTKKEIEQTIDPFIEDSLDIVPGEIDIGN